MLILTSPTPQSCIPSVLFITPSSSLTIQLPQLYQINQILSKSPVSPGINSAVLCALICGTLMLMRDLLMSLSSLKLHLCWFQLCWISQCYCEHPTLCYSPPTEQDGIIMKVLTSHVQWNTRLRQYGKKVCLLLSTCRVSLICLT